MANPTTNYGWQMPTPTDLVTDLPADFEIFGQAADGTVFANAALAVNKTIVDAKGDIIAATAADTVSRLAVGANDTVLTADSTAATGMKWAAAGGGGGMTLLATTTLATATTTISSISQDYNSLFLLLYNVSSSGNTEIYVLPNGSYTINQTSQVSIGTAVPTFSTSHQNGTGIRMTAAANVGTGLTGNVFSLQLDNYTSASFFKSFSLYGTFKDSGNETVSIMSGGGMPITTAITSLAIRTAGAATLTGTALLYGVK